MMHCADYARRLSPYVDNVLPTEERAQLEAHLEGCARCRGELASLSQMLQTLRTMEVPTVPNLLPGIHAGIQRASWWRTAWQRVTAPWPMSLPWHGLALAMSALLVIIVINRPTPGKYAEQARLSGERIAGKDFARYEPYSYRDDEISRREVGAKREAMAQAKDQLLVQKDTNTKQLASPAGATRAERANEPLKQVANERSFGDGTAGRPEESINGMLGLGNTESTSVVDQSVASTSPTSVTNNVRQLAKVSDLDELRSDEGKVDPSARAPASGRRLAHLVPSTALGARQDSTPWAEEETSRGLPVGLHKQLPEAPASMPAAPVGGARIVSATGDTSSIQSAVGGESLRAKTEVSPVWSLEVAPEDQACSVDADCVIVVTRCDNCECGTPANKAREQKYFDQRLTLCATYPGPVCLFYCPTPAHCLDYRCTLSASKSTE